MKAEIVGKRVKELIQNRKINVEELAKELGISKKDLEDKLEGKEEFFVSEVINLTRLFQLDINTVNEIFFKEDKDELGV